MGHGLQVLAETYAHVIADLRGVGPIDPDVLIDAARRAQERPNRTSPRPPTTRLLPTPKTPRAVGERTVEPAPQKRPEELLRSAKILEADGGLEPPTPSLRVMCSTS